MNIRDRIEAFWSGERPDQIPYTIYGVLQRHTSKDPAWQSFFNKGMGVTFAVSPFKQELKNVEYVEKQYQENGSAFIKYIYRTPVGEICKIRQLDLTKNGTQYWTQKYWIKSIQDYKVMKYILENTEIIPNYEDINRKIDEAEPYGVVHLGIGRTPLQTLLVDYVGLENFSYHLFDYEDEVLELYDVLLGLFERKVEIAAVAPGRYISILENFSSETLGPLRFKKFHIPVYKKYIPILQSAGKIVGTHYDGKLSSCSDLIAEAPMNLIESLTPPPEGDMTLAECRQAWPDKLLWVNINASNYILPPKELRNLILDLVQQCSRDGKRLAFEISEGFPLNWKESIPVVLEALCETRI